jgi:hypothetical protein
MDCWKWVLYLWGDKLFNRMNLKSIFTIISVILTAILFYTIINFNNYSAKNYFKVVEEKFDNGKVQTRKKIPIDNAMMSDFIRYDMEGHIDKITIRLDSTNLNANNHYFTLSFQNEKNSITCIEHFINEESVNFLILDTILYRQKINRCIENAEYGIKYTIENIKLNKKHKKYIKEFEEELQMREEDKISLLNESKVIKVREQWVKPSFDKLFSLEKKLGYHITYLKSNNKVEVMNLVYEQDGEILEIRLYNYRNYQNGDYYQLNFEKKEVKKIQQFINYKLVDTAFPI